MTEDRGRYRPPDLPEGSGAAWRGAGVAYHGAEEVGRRCSGHLAPQSLGERPALLELGDRSEEVSR